MKKCPSCNSYNDELNAICEYCGERFPDFLNENSFDENNRRNNNQGYYNDFGQNTYNNRESFDMSNYRTTEEDKAGVEALVFGILSFFCCPLVFGPLAISRGNESRSAMGTAGKILGIVGICIWALGFWEECFLGYLIRIILN